MRKRKRLGQHFLTSQSVAKSIVQAAKITKNDTVLEIGDTAGLDVKVLEEKLRSRSLKELIEENKRSADENIVMGVPTIYFNDFRVHGTQSTDVYRTIIKKHLMN